jgi:hypothetical protein
MLASLALISAIAAYVDFARTGDVRWLIGGTVRQLALFRSLTPGSSLPARRPRHWLKGDRHALAAAFSFSARSANSVRVLSACFSSVNVRSSSSTARVLPSFFAHAFSVPY